MPSLIIRVLMLLLLAFTVQTAAAQVFTGSTESAERIKLEEKLASLAKQAAVEQKAVAEAQKNINIKRAQIQKETAGGDENSEAAQMAKAQIAFWEARLANAEETLSVYEQERELMLTQYQDVAEKSGKESSSLLPIINVGETVEVIVLEDPELNGLYTVREGGYILIPALGRVRVEGLTLLEAEVAIKTSLEETQIQDATVVVEKPMAVRDRKGQITSAGIIFLTGEFDKPGVFEIPPGFTPTLAKTIIAAGGVSDEADLSRVRHVRMVENISDSTQIDLVGLLEGKFFPRDIPLLDGDIIYIPGSEDDGIVYVTGNVEKPDVVSIPKGESLTAYSAILRAGGFARFAKRSKVYVLRNRGGGQKVQLPVNISDIQRGFSSDVVLEDGDIVVVPEKFFSF